MSCGFVITLYGREECHVDYSYQICRWLCIRHLKSMLNMWRTNRNYAIKGEMKVEFGRRGFFSLLFDKYDGVSTCYGNNPLTHVSLVIALF